MTVSRSSAEVVTGVVAPAHHLRRAPRLPAVLGLLASRSAWLPSSAQCRGRLQWMAHLSWDAVKPVVTIGILLAGEAACAGRAGLAAPSIEEIEARLAIERAPA